MTEPAHKKIAKLLALALDRAGTPEGDLAAERAARMMERHGLTEADMKDATTDNPMTRRIVEVPKAGWVYILADAVGRLTGTYVAASHGNAWFMGRRTDVDVAEYLLGSLQNQCNADAANEKRRRDRQPDTELTGAELAQQVYYGRNPRTDRRAMRTYRDSWVAGLRSKIAVVLEAQGRARPEDRDEALVPTSRRTAAERWAHEQFKFGGGRKLGYRPGDQSGRAAGRSATINPGVGGRAARRLTS